MEDRGLPTVRDVITKLKFDGKFDNFRKSCVNSIENEPLFRAQKEEVEVLSRKFLQRGHWDDKTLKSDIRLHLKNYVLDVLHRPEAINQLGFIAEKILSRKHKEFMTQINEVTQSLQDTVTSNYRDENIPFGGTRKEPVKATETAVDLLQSFAISTPTVKKAPTKSFKQSKPFNSPDSCSTAVSKEDSFATIKDDVGKEAASKDVKDNVVDDVKLSKELKSLHKQHKVISSSEDSDNDVVPSSPPTDKRSDDGNTFTILLHDKLYPCHNEQPEVKWLPRAHASTNPVVFLNKHKQYTCYIHPAAPWHRGRKLNCKATDVSDSSPVFKDGQEEDKVTADHDEAKQTSRLKRKRTRESEHPSSDSETEPTKTSSADNPVANEQVAVNPIGTRTSKRVRRAPIKLRQ